MYIYMYMYVYVYVYMYMYMYMYILKNEQSYTVKSYVQVLLVELLASKLLRACASTEYEAVSQ